MKKLYEDGQLDEAIQAAEDMHHEGFAASTDVLYSLLQGCIDNKDLTSGRRVHQLINNCGFVKNAFLGSHLIRMFTLCGSVKEATHVFDNIPMPTVFTWQALITAYALNGNAMQAIEVYQAMQMSNVVPDQYIFVSVLKACAKAECLDEGKLIHAQIVVSLLKSNAYVDNTLIDMYAKCHSLKDAHFVFDRVLYKDVVTWTAIIAGYGDHGHNLEAIVLFQQMQCEGMTPNSVTYISIFKACSEVMMQSRGSFLHACMSGSDVVCDITLGNTLVAMYGKCRRLRDAFEMLKWMPKKDIVTWNVLIAANVQYGHCHEALLMYQNLQKLGFKPDDVTFVSILRACSCISALERGKLIHVDIVDSGLESLLFVRNALIDMYGKCGHLKDAYAVFRRSFLKIDIVTWNTLIAGYIQHTHDFEALVVFHQMQKDGIESDSVTYVYALQACSSLASLVYGMLIHVCIILSGISIDFYLLSCLIDMYIKCESFEDAQSVLEQSPQKNMVLGSDALLASCVWHGQEEDLSKLPYEEAITAYSATFIKLLKACASLNALDLGKQVHGGVIEVFHELNLSIGNALIDMYAKCGSIKDAHSVLCRMSNRDVVTWTTVIGGYGHYQFASQCFEKMVKEGVTPVDTTFVCLLTACSRAGLVKEGCKYFKSMVKDYGLLPTVDHYYCMVDLFGRSGRLIEAEDILQTIPLLRPTIVGPRTLLNHCKFHGNVELGQQWIVS